MTHYLHIVEARTPWQRLIGLLGRAPLPAGTALRLTPCRAVHSLGMGHAIDVVFLDRRGGVCAIRAPLVPWRVAYCRRAYAVLELRAGEVSALGIRLGGTVQSQAGRASPSSPDAEG